MSVVQVSPGTVTRPRGRQTARGWSSPVSAVNSSGTPQTRGRLYRAE